MVTTSGSTLPSGFGARHRGWGNSVAVVTGGASGIGLSIVRGLLVRGARVVVADIEQVALHEVAPSLAGYVDAVRYRCTDVADPTSVAELAAFTNEEFGNVNLLFNNAGVSITGPTWQFSADDWRWIWSVNVGGVINGIQAFLPSMLEHGEDAYIVNTSSLGGFRGIGDHAPYCASKAAVIAISQSLYSEMRAMMTRVGVSVLCPGFVSTRIHRSWRNRPGRDVAWSARESRDPDFISRSEAMQSSGASPDAVAEAVFAAMEADRFYIYSEPSTERYLGLVLGRAITGENPVVATWGVDNRPLDKREPPFGEPEQAR